jgi:hypothetical protein
VHLSPATVSHTVAGHFYIVLFRTLVEEPFIGAIVGSPFPTEPRFLLHLTQGGKKRAIHQAEYAVMLAVIVVAPAVAFPASADGTQSSIAQLH